VTTFLKKTIASGKTPRAKKNTRADNQKISQKKLPPTATKGETPKRMKRGRDVERMKRKNDQEDLPEDGPLGGEEGEFWETPVRGGGPEAWGRQNFVPNLVHWGD